MTKKTEKLTYIVAASVNGDFTRTIMRDTTGQRYVFAIPEGVSVKVNDIIIAHSKEGKMYFATVVAFKEATDVNEEVKSGIRFKNLKEFDAVADFSRQQAVVDKTIRLAEIKAKLVEAKTKAQDIAELKEMATSLGGEFVDLAKEYEELSK